MEPYERKDAYIFVSYSHRDRESVLKFVAELQKYCNVWCDAGINAGNEQSDKIAYKLVNCSLFLYYLAHRITAIAECAASCVATVYIFKKASLFYPDDRVGV